MEHPTCDSLVVRQYMERDIPHLIKMRFDFTAESKEIDASLYEAFYQECLDFFEDLKDSNNWETALKLRVTEDQRKFVPSVAVSLAKVYIKPDGEHVEYIPFAIYNNDKMVGFIMHAYEENTENMYWINGFFIDEREQGRGYGGSALSLMISWIQNKFTQCKEIRLTVHRENGKARSFYLQRGFEGTGAWFGEEEILKLNV